MLENFDIPSLSPNSAEHLHLFIEAKKLAFEDRAIYYADMDFARVPLQQLISKEYGKERAKLIDPKKAAQQVTAGRLSSSSDTTYLCAADKEGTWYPSFKVFTMDLVPAWCRTIWDLPSKIVANSFRSTRLITIDWNRTSALSTPSFLPLLPKAGIPSFRLV
jgi:hypothetical protein